jgi:hypothetical protein
MISQAGKTLMPTGRTNKTALFFKGHPHKEHEDKTPEQRHQSMSLKHSA